MSVTQGSRNRRLTNRLSDSSQQSGNIPAGNGVPPIRRDVAQGFQHKAPLGQTRMRQRQRSRVHLAVIIQQIQVQASGGIGAGTGTPESRFDLMQKCHESKGLERSAQCRHGIEKTRIAGIGPGFSLVKGRNRGDFESGAGERLERRPERPGRGAGRGRNIGAQTDENRAGED